MNLYRPIVDKDLKYFIDNVKEMYANMSPRNQAVNLGRCVYILN